MTHDELLDSFNTLPSEQVTPAIKALRAVVELHKPMESDLVKGLLCPYCFNYNYPCPTIQAIEKELG